MRRLSPISSGPATAQSVFVTVIKKFTVGATLSVLLRAVLALLCLQAILLASQAQAAPLILGTDSGPLAMTSALEFWVDPQAQTTVEAIEAGDQSRPFAAVKSDQPHLLDSAALWLRFDAVSQNPRTHWKLLLPLPGVDKITLYYRDSQGQWVVQQAGDTLPISAWPQPGRYPVLSLSHEVGPSIRYYLRITHARVPFSMLPRIVSDTRLTTIQQSDHFLLGAYFGLAVLVTLLALINALTYRDWGFASYAVYMATFAGAQASFTGVAGLYWWPQLPALNNIAVVLLPLSAAATALWFVRTVTTPKRFSRALDWFMLALIVLLPLVALSDAAFPSLESFSVINILVSASIAVLLMAIGVSLFEGDRHTRWIALGFLPILLATLFPLLRNFGLLASGFMSE